jgi:PhnB protein
MKVNAYLSFDGRTEEALDFYKKAVGAEVLMLMRFKDAPPQPAAEGCATPGTENKVMHASFRVGDSLLMASDGSCTGQTKFSGVSLALETANDDEAKRAFAALGQGGQVYQPLISTFFSSQFGIVADKFGLTWMVTVAQKQ